MFISKEDFYSHIYEEAIATISRGDDTKLDQAILTATNQVKRSLSRYDTALIFAAETAAEKAPYAELIMYIKDIAKWHFIAVCNVQVDLELAERRYNAAVKELGKFNSGLDIPGWPLLVENTQTIFRSGSATKFNHYF